MNKHSATTLMAACVLVAMLGCGQGKPTTAQKPGEEKQKSTAKVAKKNVPAEEVKEDAKTNKEAETTDKASDDKQPAESGAPSEKVMLGSAELLSGIPGEGDLTIEQIETWLADEGNHKLLEFELPLGMAAGKIEGEWLEKNPLTRAKIELGRQLYFDKRLSVNNTISCASCHDANKGYAANTRFGQGIHGPDGKPLEGNRNSPVAYNRILSGAQFWDGRATSLEDQAVGPMANAIEMGNTHENVVKTLKSIPGYKLQFDKIFGGELVIEAAGKALASFERAIVTAPTPFDYHEQFEKYSRLDPEDIEDWKQDDPEQYVAYEAAQKLAAAHPMSESAIRGKTLFFSEKANCTACHVGPNFSDELYHNLGVGMDAKEPDLGRFAVTKDEKDKGAFKTPTIRNVGQTAPYMHDGSQQTLAEVVEWYAKGGHPNPHLSDKIKKLELTEQDKKDLVEFMLSVTGDLPKVEPGRLPPSGT